MKNHVSRRMGAAARNLGNVAATKRKKLARAA